MQVSLNDLPRIPNPAGSGDCRTWGDMEGSPLQAGSVSFQWGSVGSTHSMALGGPGGSKAYPGRHEKVASAPGWYSGSVVVTLPCARKGAKQRSSSKATEESVTDMKH